jgi:hypothetical protein
VIFKSLFNWIVPFSDLVITKNMPLVIHIANDVLNIALSMKILNFAKRVGEAKDAGIAGNDMYDAAADFGDWTESGFEELANGILAIGIIGLVYQLGLLAYFARAGVPTADDWQTILWVVFGAYLLDLPAACMTICYMKYDGQDALSIIAIMFDCTAPLVACCGILQQSGRSKSSTGFDFIDSMCDDIESFCRGLWLLVFGLTPAVLFAIACIITSAEA